MKTMSQVSAALRRKNRKQYLLLTLCIMLSVTLITAYATVMRSPTVLTILPEGGDSRKQVIMIFVLAIVGCGVFTAYASSLFFRFKSRETGVFMALGASRRELAGLLARELAPVALGSCALGALAGMPLAWGVWQLFRLFVNTKEMVFRFDPQSYLITGAFCLYVLAALLLQGMRFIRRTNILDVLNAQRKSEPIRHDIKGWYGPLSLLLIVIGGVAGYYTPVIFVTYLNQMPPFWAGITYLPLFIGLYMALVYTVVHGWRRNKNRYKHTVEHSMMKFQGRQTVRNMLVITVLLAGAYFAVFYTPMLGSGMMMGAAQRPIDYLLHYRVDQDMPDQAEIQALASEHGARVVDYQELPFANLGADGQQEISDSDRKFHYEYRELVREASCLSESAFNQVSGQDVDIPQGMIRAVLAADGTGDYMISNDMTQLTNMTTGQVLPVTFDGYLYDDMLATNYYVLDDGDYAAITQGLDDEWLETLVTFNAQEDNYAFAKQLFYLLVDRSGPECEVPEYYDRVAKIAAGRAGETYWGDTPDMSQVSFDQRDSSAFQTYWRYMPMSRTLDQNEFITRFAVYLMLFIFIAIICFAAVLVIGYTRCMTIALNNRQVYEDLGRLGANGQYLYRSVRGQVSKVFGVPGALGATLMYLLYAMIMFANDGKLTGSELAGLGLCLAIMLAMSAVLWGFYRFTLNRVCRTLDVRKG